jgi:hypothetical protein
MFNGTGKSSMTCASSLTKERKNAGN